jgi:hypothetical protein
MGSTILTAPQRMIGTRTMDNTTGECDLSFPSYIASDSVDGETIVINLENGSYYALSLEASQVWQRLSAQFTEKKLWRGDDESIIAAFIEEGLMLGSVAGVGATDAFTKFTDMEDLLLADPIHEVEQTGWPSLSSPSSGPLE